MLNSIYQAIIYLIIIVYAIFTLPAVKELLDNYIKKLQSDKRMSFLIEITAIVVQAVGYTAQTYVDAKKKEGTFDIGAQAEAFELARKEVMNLLSDELKDYIEKNLGGLDYFLETKIEEIVNQYK